MDNSGSKFPEERVEDVLGQVDWDSFLDSIPDADDKMGGGGGGGGAGVFLTPENSSWIGEIEGLLMNDDENIWDTNKQLCDDFLADILADSPPPSSEVLDGAGSLNLSLGGGGSPVQEEEKQQTDDSWHPNNDPLNKKLIRQLRNRDAAVRSRERKKMHVKDLEMKSNYLEGEVRRLGRLLQCTLAENQALRFTMFNNNPKGAAAFAVSSAIQESAVLLLESLLLGSLLWLVGIVCLFPFLASPLPTPMRLATENEGERVVGSVAARGARSEGYTFLVAQAFVKSRRCKSSRTRMRLRSFLLQVMV